MKLLSTVYGAYIASLMILLLMMSVWSTLSTLYSEVSNNMNEFTNKLELFVNRPIMEIELINNTLYLEIHAYKPFKIAYVIIEYINGTIIFKKIDKVVYNDTTLKILDNSNSDLVKVGIISDDGIALYYNPKLDLSMNNIPTYIEKEILQNTQTNSNYEFIVNPTIGWAFNKTIVIKDGSGTLYYFIPYYLGNETWSSTVNLTDANFTSYTATIYFYDDTNGKEIRYVEAVRSTDATYIDVYIVYTDGTKRYLGRVNFQSSNTFYVDWSGRKDSSVYTYKLFNITYHITFGISKITVYYDYDIYSNSYKVTVVFDGTSNRYIVLTTEYNRTYLYIISNYPYGKINLIMNAGETRTITSYSGYDDFVKRAYLTTSTLDIPVSVTRTINIAYLGVVNFTNSYEVSINVPYVSYDVYQPTMTGSTVSQYYIRPADQTIIFSYDNYLLPGANTLRINATVPEIYKLIIEQPNNLVPYMVYLAWLDPRLVVNITNGGSDLLIHYGLVNKNANITFKYPSVLLYKSIYANAYYMQIHNAGDTVSLNNINPPDKTIVIIPLEGPFKGEILYISIDNWTVIK